MPQPRSQRSTKSQTKTRSTQTKGTQTTTKPLLEATIQKNIIKQLNNYGLCFKVMAYYKGLPDLLFIRNDGVVFFIECKRAKGRLSPAQVITIDKLQRLNANVIVARNVDDIKQIIPAKSDCSDCYKHSSNTNNTINIYTDKGEIDL